MLADVAGWPQAARDFRATPESWSALDLIDHLEKVESEMLAKVRAKMGSEARLGVLDRVRTAFLMRVFRSSRRVKIPASVQSVRPSGDRTLEAIAKAWREAGEQLAALVATDAAQASRGGVLRHPVGGWMSLESTVAFLEVHIPHHQHQLERIRQAAAEAGRNPASLRSIRTADGGPVR